LPSEQRNAVPSGILHKRDNIPNRQHPVALNNYRLIPVEISKYSPGQVYKCPMYKT
jgi:hypothetical protein